MLQSLADRAIITQDGELAFKNAFDPIDLHTAIAARVLISVDDRCELNPEDTKALVAQTISDLLKQTKARSIQIPDFLPHLDRLVAEYTRRPSIHYSLVTSILCESLPDSMVPSLRREMEPLRDRSDWPLPPNLSTIRGLGRESSRTSLIRVSTEGRSAYEAADDAIRAFDVARGLWTLYGTISSWSVDFGSRLARPLHGVLAGPLHTLHRKRGNVLDRPLWYNPHFSTAFDSFHVRSSWAELEKMRAYANDQIASLPYGFELATLMARYARAIDESYTQSGYLLMWSLLEKITGMIGASYETLIDRVIWCYTDRSLAKEILQYLQLRRNQFVHSAMEFPEEARAASVIKQFVDPHLMNLIRNPFKVNSLDEYAQFLSLPTSMARLERQKEMLERAISERRSWDETTVK